MDRKCTVETKCYIINSINTVHYNIVYIHVQCTDGRRSMHYVMYYCGNMGSYTSCHSNVHTVHVRGVATLSFRKYTHVYTCTCACALYVSTQKDIIVKSTHANINKLYTFGLQYWYKYF